MGNEKRKYEGVEAVDAKKVKKSRKMKERTADLSSSQNKSKDIERKEERTICKGNNSKGKRCKAVALPKATYCSTHIYMDGSSNSVQCRGVNRFYKQCTIAVHPNEVFCKVHRKPFESAVTTLKQAKNSTLSTIIDRGEEPITQSFIKKKNDTKETVSSDTTDKEIELSTRATGTNRYFQLRRERLDRSKLKKQATKAPPKVALKKGKQKMLAKKFRRLRQPKSKDNVVK